MASLADAYVRIRPDTTGLDADGISKPASEMGKKAGEAAGKQFGISFSSLLKTAAVAAAGIATGQIAGFFKSTITAASDVAESTNKIAVVFGKSTQSVLDFGRQSSTSMGLSKRSYLDAVGTLGNLFVALKLPGPQAAKMSTSMVKLAGDLASFNNTRPEDALEALRSGLVGETEPLRQYGVNINAATLQTEAMKLGLIKHVKDALTPAQKATATYALILDQTKTAQGDFKRTQDGLANSTRIAAAQWDDLKAKLGELFLPIATKVFQYIKSDALPALDGFIKGLQGVDTHAGGLAGNLNIAGNAIKSFFDGITGKRTDVDGIVGTMNGLGGAIRDTGKWAADNKDIIITAVGAFAAYKVAIEAITVATKLWAFWQGVLDGALLANPIGLVVVAVVGFIAIWITAYNRVKWFHDAVNWWFGHLLQVAQWWLKGWKDVINDAMPFLKWFGDGWSKTFSDATREITSFANWFASGWSKAFSDAKPPADSFMSWFVTGWSQTFSSAKATYDSFDIWFTTGWRQTFSSAKSTYDSFDIWWTTGWRQTFASARSEAQSFFSWFVQGWTATLDNARSTGASFFSWFVSGWSSTLSNARSTISSFFSWFISGWAGVLNDIRSSLSSFFSWFVSGWASALSSARSTITSFFSWFVSGWRSTLADATNAVASGIDAIGRYWDLLKEKVRVPINFVIGFINRGIVNPVNSLVDVFGGTHVNAINPLASGGMVRGPGTGTSDSILGLSAGGQATARVSNGEYVVNAKQTAKHLPMLQAINEGVKGFAIGGLVGDVIGLVTDPIGTLSSGIGDLGAQIGGNQFGQTLLNIPKKIIEWAAKWIKDKFSTLLSGGGPPSLGGPGGDSINAILTWARVFDPTASVSSGYRPGANDYHGAGLAADIIGANMNAIAQGFYGMSSHLLELIHSPSWFVKNGIRVGPEFYASVFAEHFNHVHVAAYANALGMANGGVINEPIWGVGKSGRQYTFGERGPETVIPGVGGGSGGGINLTFHVHGDVGDAQVRAIKGHVDSAFRNLYVQMKTGRRR